MMMKFTLLSTTLFQLGLLLFLQLHHLASSQSNYDFNDTPYECVPCNPNSVGGCNGSSTACQTACSAMFSKEESTSRYTNYNVGCCARSEPLGYHVCICCTEDAACRPVCGDPDPTNPSAFTGCVVVYYYTSSFSGWGYIVKEPCPGQLRRGKISEMSE